jgi:hypothetical protein
MQFEESKDPEITTRLANYEMAFRMQSSAPELMDLRSESKATLDLYGCDPATPSFARACLLARRMIERGVRFVNIFHEGWDAHSDVVGNHRGNCKTTDQASAALVTDLKERGLLDETLVIWGGEFGRTPMVESNAALGRSRGRDHHPKACGSQVGASDQESPTELPMNWDTTSSTNLYMCTTSKPRCSIASDSTTNALRTEPKVATSD